MPSSSKKQHNFMTAVAHSPSFAKKAGVPQSVGKDFTKADKGRKFSKGGDAMASKTNSGFKAMIEKKDADALAKHASKPASVAHKGLKAGGMAGYAKGGGIETKGKTKGSMVKMAGKRFAEGGSVDKEQEAADKAAGLEESNKEKPVSFFERLRMGNIDQPGSEAYKRFGAGRGAASRAAKVPVEDAVPVKVNKEPERAMGEDERPAPTGMGAIAQAAPMRAKPTTPAARLPARTPVARPAPTAPVKAMGGSGRSGGVGGASVDELEEYAASKRKMAEPVVAAAGSGRSGGVGGDTPEEEQTYRRKKSVDEAMKGPTEKEIEKGMETAAQMLGGGASLTAIRALAKKLANRRKYTTTPGATPQLGYEPLKIGNEPLKLGMKKGGDVKKPMKKPVAKYASGGSVSSAARRGDGIATKGKTRGKMC
jgi:hypothetical protein